MFAHKRKFCIYWIDEYLLSLREPSRLSAFEALAATGERIKNTTHKPASTAAAIASLQRALRSAIAVPLKS